MTEVEVEIYFARNEIRGPAESFMAKYEHYLLYRHRGQFSDELRKAGQDWIAENIEGKHEFRNLYKTIDRAHGNKFSDRVGGLFAFDRPISVAELIHFKFAEESFGFDVIG